MNKLLFAILFCCSPVWAQELVIHTTDTELRGEYGDLTLVPAVVIPTGSIDQVELDGATYAHALVSVEGTGKWSDHKSLQNLPQKVGERVTTTHYHNGALESKGFVSLSNVQYQRNKGDVNYQLKLEVYLQGQQQ